MELKKRLIKELSSPFITLIVLVIIIIGSFFYLSASINSLIRESEPTRDAMQHMLLDVYQDNIILLDYLNTNTYTKAVELDEEVEESNNRCSMVENTIENLIITDIITDPMLISDYSKAHESHTTVEDLRDELIKIHKQELATNKDLGENKTELLKSHKAALTKAIGDFTAIINNINNRNLELQKRLIWHGRIFITSFLVLIAIFSILIYKRIKKIDEEIITPLDQTIETTKKYAEGDYSITLIPTSTIGEIKNLQKSIGNMFSLITEFAKKPTTKKENRHNTTQRRISKDSYSSQSK